MTLAWLSADPTLLVHIERRQLPQGSYAVLDEVPGTSYADSGLPKRKTLCYRARYLWGTIFSNEACATTGKQ